MALFKRQPRSMLFMSCNLFALNNAPDFTTGALFGKAALLKVLSLPVQLFPFVSRLERALHARKLKALRDISDLPHAIVALSYQCEAIVSYDTHFRAIARVLPYRTPVLAARMCSAQRSPLRIALSRVAGRPVSVQSPARRRFANGLC